MTDPTDRIDDSEEVNDVETTAQAAKQPDDDALLAELKRALSQARHDREDQMIADAQDAFSFLAVSDEFAELVFDSLWEDKLDTASRATTEVRSLIFESTELSLEIEVSSDGVYGQVSPTQSATIEMERSDGSRSSLKTDTLGSFRLAVAGSGPVRFHITSGSEVPTVTDWINLPGGGS